MSNVHELHDKDCEEIRLEQACDWITKLDRGLNADEQANLKTWLAGDKRNVSAFMDTAKMWDKMDELSRLSDLFPQAPNKASIASKWYSVAAGFLFIAIVYSTLQGLWFMSEQPASGSLLMAQASYSTGVGESNTINLPDNSKLVLNTNSFVQVKYTPEARVIELHRGELHIDVAHDKTRPLSVVAGNKVIQAVGTAFNVEVGLDDVELIVTDGKVLVAKAQEIVDANDEIEPILALPLTSLAISKGEMVKLDLKENKDEKIVKVDKAQIDASLSWRSGRLIFRGESLAEALEEISRYTEVEFEIDPNEYLNTVRVAGMFKTGDVAGLLNVLNQSFDIEHEKLDSGKIRLKHAG